MAGAEKSLATVGGKSPLKEILAGCLWQCAD